MRSLILQARTLRGGRIGLLLAGLTGLQALWMLFIQAAADGPLSFDLAEAVSLIVILLPVAAGLLAVRIVGAERDGRMAQVLAARGLPAGRRAVTKFALALALVLPAQAVTLGVLLAVGTATGHARTPGLDAMFWPTMLVVACCCAAVTSVQLGLSTLFRGPGAPMILGVGGGMLATLLPFMNLTQLAWLLPWGLSTAASPTLPMTMEALQKKDVIMHPDLTVLLVVAVTVACLWVAAGLALTARRPE